MIYDLCIMLIYECKYNANILIYTNYTNIFILLLSIGFFFISIISIHSYISILLFVFVVKSMCFFINDKIPE